MHKNFCILPFIHLATTTEGTCRLCCKVSKHDVILDDNGVPFNVNTHSIDEIWNSNHYRELRHKVWDQDQQLPECSVCWREEEIFYSDWKLNRSDELPSKRRRENQKWLHKPKTKLAEPISELVNNPRIRYYDIRLSNLCNLKCRMCWPHFSSQIVREQQQFARDGLPTHYKHYDVAEWDTKRLWASLNSGIADIEEITFVGGEPTLHDEMYELAEQLIQSGHAEKIRFKLTSNLTNIQPRFLELFEYFRDVVINGSVDGVGDTNDYIRYPSDWTTIERNIDRLLNTESVLLNLTPVIQFYNIFNLYDMIHWYTEKWIQKERGSNFLLTFDILYDPAHLSVLLLDYDAKNKWYHTVLQPTLVYLDETLAQIENHSENVRNYWRVLEELRKRITNLAIYMKVLRYDENDRLEFMIYSSENPNPKHVKQLLAYTKQLDEHRKQDITEIIPNFYEMTQ